MARLITSWSVGTLPPRASGKQAISAASCAASCDPPAVCGGHRIVVADHDNAVAGEAGIEFPHAGSKARGDPERGQRVLIGMGAGAAMPNAEWAFDNVRRPTIALDKLSDQRLQSSIRLSPSCLHHRMMAYRMEQIDPGGRHAYDSPI